MPKYPALAPTTLRAGLLATLTLFSLFTLAGCGGGGGSSAITSAAPAAPATDNTTTSTPEGEVTVLVTDGPADDFDQILVTVSEIRLLGGDSDNTGPVLLDTAVDIDLLALDDFSTVLASAGLPPGTYQKIRLVITALTLNTLDTDGTVLTTVSPALPANGRIDLKLEEDLIVAEDGSVVLEIDLDAGRSFKFTGNGDVRFRPVLFTRQLNDSTPGKPVKGRGTIDSVDADNSQLLVCRVAAPGATSAGDDAACATLAWTDDTAFVAADGTAAAATDLIAGSDIAFTGLASRSADGVIIQARVISFGERNTFKRYDGVALSAVSEGLFRMQFDAKEGNGRDTTIAVAVSDITRFIGRSGALLTSAAVTAGTSLEVEGQLQLSDSAPDQLNAIAVIIRDRPQDNDNKERPEIKGRIADLDLDAGTFALQRGRFSQCVSFDADTRFAVLAEDDDGSELTAADAATALANGRKAEASGSLSDGCLTADTIIVKLDDDDDDDDDVRTEVELKGVVTAFDADSGRLDLSRGDSSSCVLVTETTDIRYAEDLAPDNGVAFSVGDLVKAEGESLDGGCLVADEIKVSMVDDDDDDSTSFRVSGTIADFDLGTGQVFVQQDDQLVCLLVGANTDVELNIDRQHLDGSLEDLAGGLAVTAGGFAFEDDCLVTEKLVIEREPFALVGVLVDFGPDNSFFVSDPTGAEISCFVVDDDVRVRSVLADGTVRDLDFSALQNFFNVDVEAKGPRFVPTPSELSFTDQCLFATDLTFAAPTS